MTCPGAPCTEWGSWAFWGNLQPIACAPSTQAALSGCPGCALHHPMQEAPGRAAQHLSLTCLSLRPVPFTSPSGYAEENEKRELLVSNQ